LPSIADTLESVNRNLAEYHPELPGLLKLTKRSPNSRLVTHGKQQAVQELLDQLARDSRTRIGIIGNTGLLDTFLSFSSAKNFEEVHLIDDDRVTSYYAQSFGIQHPLSTKDLESRSLDAVVLDTSLRTSTRTRFESLALDNRLEVYPFDPQTHIDRHRQEIAEQIAGEINALQPDVLYLGHFAYFNLCKQSMILRKNGKKTAILLQIPNNMEFKEQYFDAMFTSHTDDILFCHILALLKVPLIHVQGWMTLSYLPLLIKAANKKSKIVCEFNDISSLFTDWKSFAMIWNKADARLEQISEEMLFRHMDGLIFNLAAPSAEALMRRYDSVLPKIEFHSYPVQEFFAPPAPPGGAEKTPSEEFRLAFIGTLNASNLPKEFFGDVQLLPMLKRLVRQKIHCDIFLLPYQAKNNSLWDYSYFENSTPYFNILNGLPPDEITHALIDYDYGVMFYLFSDDFRVLPDHLQGILPTKFFTFMEAGIPVIVSEELAFVATIVRKHGLGVVVSQEDLDSLPALLASADRDTLCANIYRYREENVMDNHIVKLARLYDLVLAGGPEKGCKS